MSDKPIVYMEVGFFMAFLKAIEKPFSQIVEKDKLLFIDKLLKEAKVYIDLEEDEIKQIVLLEKKAALYDRDLVFGIKERLSKSNSDIVGSCKKELAKLKGNVADEWRGIKPTPFFLLLDCNKNAAVALQDRIGITCIPKDLKFDSSISSLKIKQVCLDENEMVSINVYDYINFLPQSFSLVVEDPYFYLNAIKVIKDNKFDFLEDLLQRLYNINFRNKPLEVLIIVPDEEYWENRYKRNLLNIENFIKSYDKLEKRIEFLNKEHKGRIHLEVHKNKSYKMHDRNVLSNTFWISCSHSFQREYNTNTEWTYKPIGIYYPLFKKRVEFATRFIKMQDISATNRLASGLV